MTPGQPTPKSRRTVTQLRGRTLQQTPMNNPLRPRRRNFRGRILLGGLLCAGAVGLATTLGANWFNWPNGFPTNVAAMGSNENYGPPLPKAWPLPFNMTRLTASLQKDLVNLSKLPKLEAGIFFVDLDSGDYLTLHEDEAFSAASTIKLPVLMALFAQIDKGTIRLDEPLVLSEATKGDGSGYLQYKPVGTQLTVYETADLMIVDSDNSATNMLIERLGGKEVLNEQFRAWNLRQTEIKEPLPDLTGQNTTSPRDLSLLMGRLEKGLVLSPRSRDRALEILYRTKTRTLLPSGLGPGSRIAHKTGDIKTSLGNTGIIDLVNGKRYILTVLVKRPPNDRRANQLIRDISQRIYLNRMGLPFTANTPKAVEKRT
jgi:beta-lactamase class A